MTGKTETATGRLMALDLGEKRIGIALCDEHQMFAKAFTVIRRQARVDDFEKILRIAAEQNIQYLVVGLPILEDGSEGTKAKWVRDYGKALSAFIDLAVEFWDESYSTVDAEDSLRQRGIKGKKRRQRIDAAAAAFILQSYLDAHRQNDFIPDDL